MLTSLVRIGHAPTDTERDRRLKSTFAVAMIAGTLFALQLVTFDDRTRLQLVIDGMGIVGTVGSLVLLQASKRLDQSFMFVAGLVLVVICASLLLAGNRNGDLFILTVIPTFAVVLLGPRRSLSWFTASLLVVVVAVVADASWPELTSPFHRSEANPAGLLFSGPKKDPLTPEKLIAFLTSLTLIYLVIYSAYNSLQQANERIEGLLLNVLPSSIAARLTEETRKKLREEGAGIADEYSEATILFADIVGFTDLAAKATTAELIAILDEVFTAFDHLAETHEVEKIKTIGDAYMAVCGLPEPNPDHATNVAEMALEMLAVVRRYRDKSGVDIRLRIGLNSGPVVAGIIGRKKFIYDLWGDAVNIASRMESHGAPDRVQVSAGTYAILKDSYAFEACGDIEVKGKGRLPAWHLLGRKGG